VDFDGRFFNLRRAVLGLSPFGAEDWTALAELWEPDAELVATGARPRRGREDIVAYYPRVLAGYAEHEDRPVRRIKDGSTVVVEVSYTGRTPAGRLVRGR
jgi:hypothetical protein